MSRKWKIHLWEIPTNFQREEGYLLVKESPEEVLDTLEEFLKVGYFTKVKRTTRELHMISGHTESMGCMGALAYLMLCILSFGFALIGLFALALIPSPDVRVEAKRVKWGSGTKGRATQILISGNPPKAINLAGIHLRENLHVVSN